MDKEKIKNELIELLKKFYEERGLNPIQYIMNTWDSIVEGSMKRTDKWTKEELENLKQELLIEIEKFSGEKNEI